MTKGYQLDWNYLLMCGLRCKETVFGASVFEWSCLATGCHPWFRWQPKTFQLQCKTCNFQSS